jgi:hypothetical protein
VKRKEALSRRQALIVVISLRSGRTDRWGGVAAESLRQDLFLNLLAKQIVTIALSYVYGKKYCVNNVRRQS